jgi:hypothetical protein
MKRFLSLILTLGLLITLAEPASAAAARAAVMRLQLAEGSVSVQDSVGNSLSYVKDMRLYSGYTVSTGSDSSAYILLDDTKAVKLDRDTTVTIRKSWRKLQVKLKCGQLSFNVTSPLEANESMEIRTSSMVLGVRGSSGVVSLREVIFVTGHGVVHGGGSAQAVAGGQAFRPGEGVSPAGIFELPAFFLREVRDNSELQDHIRQEGVYRVEQLIAALPAAEAREAEELEAAMAAVEAPPAAESVDPAFGKASYTVTWKDGDRVLKTERVSAGTVPAWSGKKPVKESDEAHDYAFSGWTPEPSAADGDAEYTAVFKASDRKYTVTWRSDDGSVIDTTSVAYGKTPKHDAPVKEGAAGVVYAFTGWDRDPVPVTGDAEYTAVFETTYDFAVLIPQGTDNFYYEVFFPTEGNTPITTAREGEEFTFYLGGAPGGVSVEVLVNGYVLGGGPVTFHDDTEAFVCTFIVPKDPVIEIRPAAADAPAAK